MYDEIYFDDLSMICFSLLNDIYSVLTIYIYIYNKYKILLDSLPLFIFIDNMVMYDIYIYIYI